MTAKRQTTKAHQTPVMQQHAAAKEAYPDAVVLFRLGDFYEMFGEDALLCSRVLGLTLTSRNKGKPDEIPMAGVPHHAAPGYIGRLLAGGHRVALCEQMADPSTTRGIVPREVVRVITPGTITDEAHLSARSHNWLAALEVSAEHEAHDETRPSVARAQPSAQGVGLCFYDLSTGEMKAAALPSVAVALVELSRHRPRELILGGGGDLERLAQAVENALGALPLSRENEAPRETEVDLNPHCELLSELVEPARQAALRAVQFAQRCNPSVEIAPARLSTYDPSDSLLLSESTQDHLELVRSASGDHDLSLLSTIDRTCSAAGGRLLRQRLLSPLTDIPAIRGRLDRVECLVSHAQVRRNLRQALSATTDLERLATRARLGDISPRDVARLRDGLLAAEQAIEALGALASSATANDLRLPDGPPALRELRVELQSALIDRPAPGLKDDAIFREGYDSELTELSKLHRNSSNCVHELEQRLRETLDLSNLKIRYTRVFGWYVEVGRSQINRVPKEFRRKQTVASGERYSLDELDELAARMASAEEGFRARQSELFALLVERVVANSAPIFSLAAALAAWDCAAGLAELAHEQDYVRPDVDEGYSLDFVDGRHPVVERYAARGRFVPNDVALDAGSARLWLLTGPNMAGKSTLLRQTAILAILAQMGSFVPARSARVGVVDRVLSRVGAGDNLARGESTFMVEMREMAEILAVATRRSLVIVDEIGRGTSTFDGLSIAWAVAEHLQDTIQCRCLFATHYHELTALAQDSPHSQNHSVSAQEVKGEVVFLHRLIEGPASRSYGVAVARLAGLPASVVERAEKLLKNLESQSQQQSEGRPERDQLSLFEPVTVSGPEQAVLEALQETEPDHLTPMAALALVTEWKHSLAETRPEARKPGRG